MPSIFEDIQALKERFRAEFGLEVSIDLRVYDFRNDADDYQPERKAEDIINRGGFEGYKIIEKEHNGVRWVEVEPPAFRYGSPRMALFYPIKLGGELDVS